MSTSPTLSTVTITEPSGGNTPDGIAVATMRVTVRDENGATPSDIRQVKVTPQAPGNHIVDHAQVWAAGPPGIEFSYTNAFGVVDIPLRSLSAETVSYLVEVGEDDGTIPVSLPGNALYGKPERDFPVGCSFSSAPQAFIGDLTIDAAWIAANFPSGTVTDSLFSGTVTLAVSSVRFEHCTFSNVIGFGDYCLVTAGYRYTAVRCTFRGSTIAAVYGPGGVHDKCIWASVGQHGVYLEQSDPDEQSTQFLSCLFRLIGQNVAGYAILGEPMRNVYIDHCWFDLSYSTQVTGRTLACVRQVTEADGARGPFIYSSWIEGGEDYFIESVTGASGEQCLLMAVRACRFGSLSVKGGPGCLYLLDQGAQSKSHGNMTDADGVLIPNTVNPGVNLEAGPRYLWPQTALATVPSVTWAEASTGGGTGNPGDPGGGAGVPGTALDLTETTLVTMAQVYDRPVGAGSGVRTVTLVASTDIQAATPVPLDDGSEPSQFDPLVVEFATSGSTIFEGGRATIFVQLFDQQGQIPAAQLLRGFIVPISQVDYVGTATAADFILPTEVVFPVGASVASIEVFAVDDLATEAAESCRLWLGEVQREIAGELFTVVVPGANLNHLVTIDASDASPTVRTVGFGVSTASIGELNVNTALGTANIPILISGNPSGQVQVQVALSGSSTATIGSDFTVNNPGGSSGTFIVQFNPTPDGSTPAPQYLSVSILDDATYEVNETAIFNLTMLTSASIATVGTVGQVGITLLSDDPQTPVTPIIGWEETSLSLRELTGTGSNPQVTRRAVGVGVKNGQTFGGLVNVGIDVQEVTAQIGLDFDVLFSPPNAGTFGVLRFFSGDTSRNIEIVIQPDGVSDDGESFVLSIQDGTGYEVEEATRTLTVLINDPFGDETQLFVRRLDEPSRSTLVSTSLYMREGYDPANGFSMTAPGAASGSTCQWHPVSYRADGTPDVVRVWAMLPHSGESVPDQANVITIESSTATAPTPAINVLTQFDAVRAGLELVLRHNVNGETRDFSIDYGSASYNTHVDTGNVASQGGGPRLFARYSVKESLAAPTPSSVSNDYCTVARTYFDCRADLNAVVVAVNWGNFRWKAPDGTFTHESANPYVDGEVYFDSLDLEGIPSGWAAVILDPRTSRSEYDSANNRVRIIKPLGGTERHFVPPLRGHMAYICLYEQATVTEDTAYDVLRGFDMGVSVGGFGLDQNDALSEVGTPMLNYGQVGFVNYDNTSGNSGQVGWEAVTKYSNDFLTKHIKPIVANGLLEVGGAGGSTVVARGWWHPLEQVRGDNPSGSRIDVSAGTYPGRNKLESARLQLIHLWHRYGNTAWTNKAGYTTDEDFATATGNTYYMSSAMWMGKGGQRMSHQHFYVPEYQTTGSGVHTSTLLGPGRKRSTGRIVVASIPTSGNSVTIDDGTNSAITFEFGTGSDTPTLIYVAIGSSTSDCATNLYNAINAVNDPGTLDIYATKSGSTISLTHMYQGVVGDQTITQSGSSMTLTGMSGGSNGTNVRLWNYQTPGATSCSYDVDLSWHRKSIAETFSYHCFDWPHAARMNTATRDLWWLYMDPLAYDVTQDMMGLATQCAPRYRTHPTVNAFLSGGETQLSSACRGSNLALIAIGYNLRLFREYVTRGLSNDYTAAMLGSGSGLNIGLWVIPNPSQPTFDPSLSYHYNVSEQHPIDRGWGWLLATVARGYAISPAMRPTSTAFDERTRLHSNPRSSSSPSIFASSSTLIDRPSWFDAMAVVLQNTMHLSGAASSQDTDVNSHFYDPTETVAGGVQAGAPNFNTRVGAIPGGAGQPPPGGNTARPSAYDDEWYAHVRTFMQNYIALGAYAVQKRVYTWVDGSTTTTPSDFWYTRTRNLYHFMRRAFVMSRVQYQSATEFFVPSTTVVGVGVPADAGTAASTGKNARFNPETGQATPDIAFRSVDPSTGRSRVWWWHPYAGAPGPSYYDNQYWITMLAMWRLEQNVEMRDLIAGPMGFAGPLDTAASSIAPWLLGAPPYGLHDRSWYRQIQSGSSRYVGGFADEAAWIIQFLRNDFGAP